MKKVLFSTLLVSLLAGCAGQDVKDQPKAAVEDRTATQAGADVKSAGQQVGDGQSPERSQQHPLQAQRLLRFRQV